MDRVHNPADGVAVAFRAVGEGSPVVLLHPTGLSQAVWRSFGYVDGLDGHRLVLPDFRGHGRSDKPHDVGSYAMDRLVGDVVAVLDECGIDRTSVVGYSLGSRVALALATSVPDRIDRLVLGGTSSRALHGAFDELFFPGCAAVLADEGMDAFITRWERQRGTDLDPATRAAFDRNDAAALSAYMTSVDAEPGVPDDALAGIAAPTLAFVGSADGGRLEDTRHVAATIPDCGLVVVDGTDHATTLAATSTVLPAIREHLATGGQTTVD
ncbi:alpha/beta fold hydrolase [Williamsia deligens]|uniref:Alpha/beta fold hydrolase n=1 Tax=Williamsia deligens TaxID=321325 RepID=A0ABW3G9U0_9NOCA|nr:alpha/beta hydrolase [Williamsia deligens]MCP2193563.1 Pimeloyl-ACP methyl ester carboxylesterase [Williamsia deligens]